MIVIEGCEMFEELNNKPSEDIILKEAAPSAAKLNKGTSIIPDSNFTTTVKSNSSLNWADDYILSNAEADKIADPAWLIENLIIRGHLILLPAEPNGGKTTIMFHLAGVMAQQGNQVFYVNVDISGGDVKPLVKQAKTDNFTLMLPDMMLGKSIDNVIEELRQMADTGERFDTTVFIFDTLKKMLNVINKCSAKEFFQLFRKLSALGMTVIFLAHTNKYKDKDGKPIYEGTGDMRADVDELIFFIPLKHDDGSMTVSTHPDKTRGSFKPISFNIDPDRNVSLLDEPVDTVEANKIDLELKGDYPVIDAIAQSIKSGSTTQKDIISYCSINHSIGERMVKKILPKYSKKSKGSFANLNIPSSSFWVKTSGEKNGYVFSLIG
jgi:hypothetical protein